MPLLEQALSGEQATRHRTLVIFDEVHHAGVDSGWGQASQTAFSKAATAILSLSGTPFRTDRDPIVFIPSVNGAAQPLYRYTYRDAIIDGACRPGQFVEVRGRTTFRTEDGEVHEESFDEDDLSDLGAQRRMRAALEWIEPDSIADKLLQNANRYLIGLRAAGDGLRETGYVEGQNVAIEYRWAQDQYASSRGSASPVWRTFKRSAARATYGRVHDRRRSSNSSST